VKGDGLLGETPEAKAVEVLESGGRVCVLVKGRKYMSWESGDEESARMAIVQLYECEGGTREQLAEAFGVHINSVQKYITNFSREGFEGLSSQRRGPQGGWKLTRRRRSKILAVALREGVRGVEAVQERLREGWHEEISLPSIRQVLKENGLLDAENLDAEGKTEQGELFEFEGDRQLDLNLGTDEEGERVFSESEASADKQIPVAGSSVRAADYSRERRRYSSAQRVYFDRLEQGEYNAYAGGLLLAPLVERYEFLPTLRRMRGTAWKSCV